MKAGNCNSAQLCLALMLAIIFLHALLAELIPITT